MKISFLSYISRPLRTNRRVAWCIVSLICLLAGSYLVGRYFGLLAVVLLGIASVLVAGAAYARFNRNKHNELRSAPITQSVVRITSAWDYRPRAVIRRDTPIDLAAAQIAEALTSSPSAPNENDNVWFNFTNAEPTVEAATTKSAVSGNGHGVSGYD
jgi:uncharacterized membrane protein YeaQ/YmgE (transglycosylase-associated protein family)